MTEHDDQDDAMNYGLTVNQRNSLQRQLDGLQDTLPPRAVWQRIEQQALAEGLFSNRHLQERLKWIAGAAIAASVAMLALNLQPDFDTTVNDVEFAATPEMTSDAPLTGLRALKVQSQLLEKNLRLLPEQPTVMRVSTVTTIQDLEDQIAGIDMMINDRTRQLAPEQEELFWRERVRLMNLLIQLRSAQAQRLII